ncbi:MAG: N-acetylmuramoyl-L-alanine amidase [Rickettsiaceae bacterium]|jgi:N-acetylmuramoyl-L-alanine amidase|nr:N-acetylmuramoyl-L-alanine amidase [Rickettsiaceae bacterium]
MLAINREIKSPNFDDRPYEVGITHVIIHFTEIPFKDAVDRLCSDEAKVSCHYIIKDNGEIYALVDDERRAWHAGKSLWKNIEALNNCSIGIELDNSGKVPFSEFLIGSLLELCKYLKNKYNIPQENFIGHSDIAPDRKVDPGIFFPWQRLHENGFGMWPNKDISNIEDKKLYSFGDRGHEIKILQQKLKQLGYKIEVNGNYDAQTCGAVRAFQARFYSDLILKEVGVEQYITLKNIDEYTNLEEIYYWSSKCEYILNSLSS